MCGEFSYFFLPSKRKKSEVRSWASHGAPRSLVIIERNQLAILKDSWIVFTSSPHACQSSVSDNALKHQAKCAGIPDGLLKDQ